MLLSVAAKFTGSRRRHKIFHSGSALLSGRSLERAAGVDSIWMNGGNGLAYVLRRQATCEEQAGRLAPHFARDLPVCDSSGATSQLTIKRIDHYRIRRTIR